MEESELKAQRKAYKNTLNYLTQEIFKIDKSLEEQKLKIKVVKDE